MSEHTEKVAALFDGLASSDAGKMLLDWIEKTANERRRSAGKSQDTAWGELRFADGLEEVALHIEQMRGMSGSKRQKSL